MKSRLGGCVAQYTSPQPTSPQFLRDLDHAHALGMWGVRLDCVPYYTQMGNDFREVDAKVAAATARGLKAHLMLPHWTSEDKRQHGDTATLANLRGFAGRVAAHFGPRVAQVELGNEPGSPPFTGSEKPSAAFQAAVSIAMIDGLNGAYPLCTPGLAPVDGGDYVKIVPFLQAYWDDLGQQYRDAFTWTGVHLYSPARTTDRAWYKGYGQLDGAFAITGKPFMVTEFNCIGQTAQAQQVEVANALKVLKKRPDVERAFFYELSNQGGEGGYGAYDAKGVALPVVTALQRKER